MFLLQRGSLEIKNNIFTVFPRGGGGGRAAISPPVATAPLNRVCNCRNNIVVFISCSFREAAKKVSFFSGPATKRGGLGGKGLVTKKKNFFWSFEIKSKKNVATKAGALKKIAASLMNQILDRLNAVNKSFATNYLSLLYWTWFTLTLRCMGFFRPLPKISLGNPYMKIIDLAKRFVADAYMKENNKKIVLLSLRVLWNIGLKIAHAWEG